MNWDRIQGNWKQRTDEVKRRWGKLIDEHSNRLPTGRPGGRKVNGPNNLLVTGLAVCIGLAGWTGLTEAQLFSSKGPVIAILNGDLLVGEATGHLGGWGTIAVSSRSKTGLTCVGEFSSAGALGDSGQLKCSDGASAAFLFQRLSLRRGYGVGSASRSALSFMYGLTAEESAPYLKLPPGKELRGDGNNLELVAAVPFPRPRAGALQK